MQVPDALPVPLDQIQFVGQGLSRPECVLVTAAGEIHTADWRGGVSTLRGDGTSHLTAGKLPGERPLRPNGIALTSRRTFLLADLGEALGGVFELALDGSVRPLLERVNGVDLPPTNFVALDAAGRTWITVSTTKRPRALAYRSDVADGFIVLLDAKGARIVADGLGYTNEALVSPDGHWLYVNETFGRRMTRFRLGADGSLSGRETVTAFGEGTYPDGLAFDALGHQWITSIVSNRVIRVAPDGSQTLVLEDADPQHVEWAERAYRTHTLGRPHLDTRAGRRLANISSLAFGGPDLRTAYLGCLLGDSIAMFRTEVPGHPPVHWTW